MTRRFLVRLPCMERRPAEAAVRFAQGAPERRNPVAAGVSDRIGMRFACHRGGDRECIIGAVSSLRLPMRKLLILALVALMVSGCGIVYRQPIYQGNLLEKSAIDQLQPGMSKQQAIGLLGRSAERREGKECFSTCRTRWSPNHKKKKKK